jgi:hypothetical protein
MTVEGAQDAALRAASAYRAVLVTEENGKGKPVR